MAPACRPILVLAALFLGVSISAAATVVKLDTPLGAMTFQLFDGAKPVTTANFLSYISSGRYANSFAHRLPPGFVLQGGGYQLSGGQITPVPTFGSIINEPGPFPEYSNGLGTLAMAKVDGDPNSATSQWFINLQDNAGLDLVNGGFTVFGRIIDGLDVLQQFAAFTYKSAPTQSNVVVNVGSPFGELPVTQVINSQVSTSDLIFTQWSVVPEPGVPVLLFLGAIALIAWRQRRPTSR